MLLPQVRAILGFLNTCRAHRPYPQRPFVALLERIAKGCLRAGIAIFMITLAIAAWAWLGQPLGGVLRFIGVFTGLTSMVLILLALCFPIVAAAVSLRFWRSDTLVQMLSDFDIQAKYVQTLLGHTPPHLEQAQLLLAQKIARLERRAAIVVGEKVAVFTLIATGFAALQALGGFDFIRAALTQGLTQSPLMLGLTIVSALLVGLAAGSLALRLLTDRYRYELELLDLALQARTASEARS
ncbi:hypothetical protein [Pseudomonas japonica]|uniref:hypothetical protein n=1 Tax=Pseudomonas japonica TaxID=256466 RepID=UPI0015E30F6F|nr:hypothetical protein [Pseudomonas japonica]MBA1287249.1 hypothetical protein [Pseudomonas japonica]